MSKLKQLIRVDLKSRSRAEHYAWLATAILTNQLAGVSLTERANELISELRTNKKAEDDFVQVVKDMQTDDEFGFAELSSEDAKTVLKFIRSKR